MQLETIDAAVVPVPDEVRVHPGGMPMTIQTAVPSDGEAAIRWRDWQARGAVNDQRWATRMRTFVLVIGALLAVWVFVQLS